MTFDGHNERTLAQFVTSRGHSADVIYSDLTVSRLQVRDRDGTEVMEVKPGDRVVVNDDGTLTVEDPPVSAG